MRTAGTKQLQENICSAIIACSRICIIVDSLDECKKAARRDVIALLEYLLTLEITIVKVLVSCREDDQILASLDAYPRIQLSESMLATDIEAFITESVRSKINDRELRVNDPTLICFQIPRKLPFLIFISALLKPIVALESCV